MKGQGGTARSLGQKPQGMLLPEGETYPVRGFHGETQVEGSRHND